MFPYPYILSIATAALVASSSLMAVDEIIVTEFGEKGEGDLPAVTGDTTAISLPLNQPTSLSMQPPSRISVQTEGIGDGDKPAAVFEVDGLAENPEAAASAKLIWNFGSAGLLPGGVYELEYTVIPLAPPTNGGRMKFELVDASGAPLSVSLHVSKLPALEFREDGYGVAGTTAPILEGMPVEIIIRLDLETNTWDASVDGNPIINQQQLPEELIQAHPKLAIASIDFGSDGGWSDRAPAKYALVKVKLTRLPDGDSE